MRFRSASSAGWLALALLLAPSCSQTEEAAPAPSDDFLGMSAELAPVDDSPWDSAWRAPGVKWQGWTELRIPDVVVDSIGDEPWCAECPLDDVTAKREALGRELKRKVEAAFEADPRRLLRPVEEVGDKTVVLELAIVDVVPARSWFNARGAAPAGLANHGSIAIEGRITDGKTGRLISVFSDREECAADLMEDAHADWCCHAPLLFDRWAARLVALAHAAKDGRIGNASAVPTQSW